MHMHVAPADPHDSKAWCVSRFFFVVSFSRVSSGLVRYGISFARHEAFIRPINVLHIAYRHHHITQDI